MLGLTSRLYFQAVLYMLCRVALRCVVLCFRNLFLLLFVYYFSLTVLEFLSFFPILPVHGISNHYVNFSPFYFSYPVFIACQLMVISEGARIGFFHWKRAETHRRFESFEVYRDI